MADRDQDNIDQKDEDKQEGGQESSSTGIGKYFGKSFKPVKLMNSKVKKTLKQGKLKNLTITFENHTKQMKQLKKYYQMTKTKLQYKFNIQYFDNKPKLKVNLNIPSSGQLNNSFEEAVLTFKSNKQLDRNFEFKLSKNNSLLTKYKQSKFFNEKKLKFKWQGQVLASQINGFKNGIAVESIYKFPSFPNIQYLNSMQLKAKLSFKDFYYNRLTDAFFKIDLSKKYNLLINKYKLKQQTKAVLSYGSKQSTQLKANLQLTNDTSLWTAYASIMNDKSSLKKVVLDDIKFVYSIYDKWKIGCMYSQKGWEAILNNSDLKSPICTNFAVYINKKNYTLILKNKHKLSSYGRINYEIGIQNPIWNYQPKKASLGISLNVNL